MTGGPLPFEEALLPFVRHARERLGERSGSYGALLAAGARAAFERHLLRRLTETAALVLGLEFRHYVVARDPLALRMPPGEIPARPSRERYEAFVAGLLEGGLADLLREVPVMARLLATLTEDWVDATAEFLERVEEDRVRLGAVLGGGRESGRIERVRPGLSDPHHGGRGAVEVLFAGGLHVVYKPKDIGSDRAFADLLGWLDARGATWLPRPPAMLSRDGYGWMTWIDAEPCRDPEDLRDFHRRAGALLALAHFLGASDCHRENVMACGAHPLLIDTEMLVGSGELGTSKRTPDRAHGVVDTGLLPLEDGAPDVLGFDPSGLGIGSRQHPGPAPQPHWEHVNTDAMRLGRRPPPVPAPQNRPTLDGRPVQPHGFGEDVVLGFLLTWRLLRAHGDDLSAPGGPLPRLMEQPRRCILRRSEVYALLLRRRTEPAMLMNADEPASAVAHLARLDRVPAWGDVPLPPVLLRAEQEALDRGDVPHFCFHPRDGTVRAGARLLVEEVVAQRDLDWVRARLLGLGDEDLDSQVEQIRRALAPGADRSATG